MNNLIIALTGPAGIGKSMAATKIRDMLSLDEFFKDREILIVHPLEMSEYEINNLREKHPDAIFIYDDLKHLG